MLNSMHRAHRKASQFLGNTLPSNIRKASTFFGNRIMPHLNLAHKIIKNGAEEINKSQIVDPLIKKRANEVSSFASAGLKQLNTMHNQVNQRYMQT